MSCKIVFSRKQRISLWITTLNWYAMKEIMEYLGVRHDTSFHWFERVIYACRKNHLIMEIQNQRS